MTSFRIPCECGKTILVSASEAGTTKRCICRREIAIPSFGKLRESFQVEGENERQTEQHRGPSAILLFAVFAVLFGLIWLWNLPTVVFLASMAMFYGGKIWFLALMFAEMGTPAILVFLVPFLDWMFLFIRFDVAWKPILCQFLGVVLLVVGMVAVNAAN